MITMYPAKVNSPVTTLASGVNNIVTTIPLTDSSVLPDAPNLAVIGTGEDAETIRYAAKNVNDLTGCTRGFQGVAKAWDSGTSVARMFTAYDYDTLRTNVGTHDIATTGVHGVGASTVDSAAARDAAIAAVKLVDLADVSVGIPANGTMFYWDAATFLWKCIPHAALTTGVHGAGAETILNTGDVGTMAAETATDYLEIANLENPPIEDEASKAPTSEWAFDHDAATTGVHGLGANSFAGVLESGHFHKFISPKTAFYLHNVGSTPHTSNIVAISGVTVTVTAGDGTKFFNPSMDGASYMHLWNTTRGTDAWISDINGTSSAPGDILTLTANVPADWQVGDALLASLNGTSEYMEVDCAPSVSANASGAYIEMRVRETGTITASLHLRVAASLGQVPTIEALVPDRTTTTYVFAPFISPQKLRVRLRASGAATLTFCAFYIYSEVHTLTKAA